MSTPAQVTEAHRELAADICTRYYTDSAYSVVGIAKLLADNEARAVGVALADKMCEQSEFLAKANRDLIAERDQLHAELRLLRAAQKISEDTDEATVKEVLALRAEVERLTTNCIQLQKSYRYHEARAEKAEAGEASLRADLEGLRSEHAELQASRNRAMQLNREQSAEVERLTHHSANALKQHIARADRAEAELAAFRAAKQSAV